MYKNYLGAFVLLIGLLVGGCQLTESSEQTNSAQHSPLSSEELMLVLIDIHLAEAASQDTKLKRDTSFNMRPIEEYYEAVFAAHGTNREDFEASFNYYAERPVLFNSLYERMLETFSKLEAETKEAIKKRAKGKPKEKARVVK